MAKKKNIFKKIIINIRYTLINYNSSILDCLFITPLAQIKHIKNEHY